MKRWFPLLIGMYILFCMSHCILEPKDTAIPDTTRHAFTWEIDTLGDAGPGSHYWLDVAIGSNENIWVVGLVRTDEYDSATGMEYTEYNAARWDGDRWNVMGIYNNTLDLYSIQYFAEDDIWVTSHCFPYHWDGSTWTQYHLNNMGFDGVCAGTTVWGSASDDVYFAGNDGSMMHYDGATFTQVPTNTPLPIQDIWGTGSSVASGGKVLALASDKYQQQGVEIFQVTSHGVTPLPHTGLSWSMSSLWFQAGTPYYASGAGLYTIPDLPGDSLWHRAQGDTLTGNYLHHLRGTAANNIIAVGAFGTILHFNGDSWAAVAQLPANLRLLRVAVRGRLVVACGEMAGRAVVVRGSR